jgi:hypothetical protein
MATTACKKFERGTGIPLTYSYTQISQYLGCPRRYRYRYLDGWQEKGTRAPLLFGRAFEQALAAFFLGQDSIAALFREWGVYRETALDCSNGDSWDRMVRQGVQLLELFAQYDRIRIPQPRENLQVKIVRPMPGGNEFVAYIDAIGSLDGKRCLIEWKTTASRYPEEPSGLVSLGPQLICYSWITGIPNVALVVFVRKRNPEIQYLHTEISESQWQEFGELVGAVAGQIEAGQFLPHSGVRFPQNGCVSCPYLGLCLGNPDLVASNLIRRPQASEFDWLNELE